MKRTHDKFYANEDKNGQIKDAFKLIERHIRNFKPNSDGIVRVGDIGCATGVLPNYLKSVFPNYEIVGFEYLDELLSVARRDYPQIEFKKMDVTDAGAIPARSFDIITMAGVLSIFDDAETVISNVLDWIKPGGRLLVFNMFNPFDLDVFVKYKHSHEDISDGLESGWNIVSQKTVSNILHGKGLDDFSFHEFEISVDLLQRPDDLVRSWTEKDEAGRRYIINGLNLKQPQYLLEVNV